MKITPIGDRVLVKAVELETKTKGGIVLPETISKEQPTIGELVAVGDSDAVKKLTVGQKIIYAKYSGTEIKRDNEKYILLKSEDVLAVVEDI